jgi:hypothetical protein
MPLLRHEQRTKTKGKKIERTPRINRGRTKTRTGDKHKVDTQNTGSEGYTQKAKGRTSKHRRTKGQKKKRPREGRSESKRRKNRNRERKALANQRKSTSFASKYTSPPGSPRLNN